MHGMIQSNRGLQPARKQICLTCCRSWQKKGIAYVQKVLETVDLSYSTFVHSMHDNPRWLVTKLLLALLVHFCLEQYVTHHLSRQSVL